MQKSTAGFTAVGLVLATATIGGRFGPVPNRPRTALWYLLLRKPAFTPPGPLIGATWGVLDVLLIVSGYRLLVSAKSESRQIALTGWVLSVIGVAAHPFLFFGRRSTTGGLAATVSMIAASAISTIASVKVDRLASLCGVPLAIWSIFAGLLSEEITRKN